MKKTLLYFIFIMLTLPVFCNGFWWESVIITKEGEILKNKDITLRIHIQNGINNTDNVQYSEKYATTTNDYGLVKCFIGSGTPLKGKFNQIDWSQKVYLNIELLYQNQYVSIALVEISSVPKALFAENTTVSNANSNLGIGINVKTFGAKADGNHDDTYAIISAINKAKQKGNKVFLPAGVYKISEKIVVPDGVLLVGEGTGATPLLTPYNGTLIFSESPDFAFEINGCNAGLRDLVILGQHKNAKGGILINANNKLVESLRFNNILISNFTRGTALALNAENKGAIYYSSFYNIRIRNAYTGISIIESDANSCVNSNSFYHGTISGGGFNNCLFVKGGNNNKFYGTVIEPVKSNNGHIYVSRGEIQCHDVRIEAIEQPENIATIFLGSDSRHCYFSGFYAGGLTVDKGNNIILLRSGKSVKHTIQHSNMFLNACFKGLQNNKLPFWKIVGNVSKIEILTPQIKENNNVLKLTLPIGASCTLKPDNVSMIKTLNLGFYDEISFGAYIKTNAANSVFLSMMSINGLTNSIKALGDNQWHFLGSMNRVAKNSDILLEFKINNNSGKVAEVFISMPTCTFGCANPILESKNINSAGGIINGVLTTSLFDIESIDKSTFITLPKYANTYCVKCEGVINRINHKTENKFPKGTVLNLIFMKDNVKLNKNEYLKLVDNFVSNAGESIIVVSLGDGTWIELSRNKKQKYEN